MKKCFFLAIITLLLAACGKDKPADPPLSAILINPTQNQVCTTGKVLSNTQSSISFSWQAAANANKYEVDVKNLLTGAVIKENSTGTNIAITLSRNTPYSWYVVSQSLKTTVTAQSDTWKFYNAGLGIITYAPFPADIQSPAFGQQVTAVDGLVNLTWDDNDVDNDITGYDIYFGTTPTPGILKSGDTDMYLNGVKVAPGNTYYWKVVATDSQGNTSDSGLYQFSVK